MNYWYAKLSDMNLWYTSFLIWTFDMISFLILKTKFWTFCYEPYVTWASLGMGVPCPCHEMHLWHDSMGRGVMFCLVPSVIYVWISTMCFCSGAYGCILDLFSVWYEHYVLPFSDWVYVQCTPFTSGTMELATPCATYDLTGVWYDMILWRHYCEGIIIFCFWAHGIMWFLILFQYEVFDSV